MSLNSGTTVVKAYKARTLVSHANSPKVNKLRGSSRILIKGTSRKLMAANATEATKRVLNPPE